MDGSSALTVVHPEGCCCMDGEAMCLDCMQGSHRKCYDKAVAKYRSLVSDEQLQLDALERRVKALERPRR